MATLSEERIAALLAPFLSGPSKDAEVPDDLYAKLSTYLDLLVRWNERTNLTAVRAPEEVVTRHFGESLFAGLCLSKLVGPAAAVLDVGSGAGFPGLPMQLLRPDWRLTLAESQGKKVAFLREVVRVLGMSVDIWPRRVEEMPADRRFDAVTLRAVDRMEQVVALGRGRLVRGGVLLRFGTGLDAGIEAVPIPGRLGSVVILERLG